MDIQAMVREDISRLAELERECFSQPWSENTLEAQLLNPNAFFSVARVGETIAGYIGMHCVLDEGYIANVAVARAYRRQGVGQALVAHLLDYGRSRSLDFVTLEVRPSNTAAVRLYEKMGFGLAGRRRDFYANPCEDALLMTAFLHSPVRGYSGSAILKRGG